MTDESTRRKRPPRQRLRGALLVAAVIAVLPLVAGMWLPTGDRIAKELVLAYCVGGAGLVVSLLVLSVPELRGKPATVRVPDSSSAQAPAYVRLDDYLAAHPEADREAHERIARHEQQKEDAMVETVRLLPLLDAVFAYEHHRRHVVRGAYAGVRHYGLTDVLPGADPVQVQDATRRARALLDDTYGYGEVWHSQLAQEQVRARGDERDPEAEMRRDHPGFSDESYSVAFRRGLFEAMW